MWGGPGRPFVVGAWGKCPWSVTPYIWGTDTLFFRNLTLGQKFLHWSLGWGVGITPHLPDHDAPLQPADVNAGDSEPRAEPATV